MLRNSSFFVARYDAYAKILLTMLVLVASAICGYLVSVQGIDFFSSLAMVVFGVASVAIILTQPYVGLVVLLIIIPLQSSFPELPVGDSIYPVIGVLTVGSFLFQNRGQFSFRFHSLAFVFALGFIFVMILSNPTAAFTAERNWVFTYAQLFLLMWLASRLLTPDKQRLLMLGFILTSSISSAVAITQTRITGSVLTTTRSGGLTGNQNELAIYLLFGALFTIYFMNQPTKYRLLNFILPAVLALELLGIVASVSRTGFVSLAVCLLLVIVFHRKLAFREDNGQGIANLTRPLKKLLVLLGVLGILALVFVPSTYWDILTEAQQQIQEGRNAEKGTFAERLSYWDKTIAIWSTNPILGVGAGMVETTIDAAAHNMFLTVLAENGVVGLLLYLAWLASVASYLLRIILRSRDSQVVPLATIYLIALVGYCIFGLTNSFHYFKILWGLAGLGLGLIPHADKQNTAADDKKQGSLLTYPKQRVFGHGEA